MLSGSNRLAAIRRDERGIAIVVVMAVLLVLGIVSASVLATSVATKRSSAADRSKKLSYAAALTGLRAGIYRLNALQPLDNGCPPLPDGTAAPLSNGICGPYGSDTSTPGTTSATSQPLVRERYKYWISVVMQTISNPGGTTQDTCTGTPLAQAATDFPIQERCITAVGEALNPANTVTQATSRVQARLAAGVPFFPIPGMWGTNCLTINANISTLQKDCPTSTKGPGSSVYKGAIGSNISVLASIGTWGEDPSVATNQSPARMYLGNIAPGSTTHGSYTLTLSGSAEGTLPAPNDPFTGASCGGGGNVTYQYACLPYGPGFSPTSNNTPRLFNSFFQLPRMEQIFRNPPKVLRGAGTPGTGCTPSTPPVPTPGCDTATFNNNAFLNGTLSGGASYTGAGCTGSPYSDSATVRRQLSVASGCTLRLPNGTYNFCSLTIASDGKVLPADTSSQAEIRVMIDSPSRLNAPDPYKAPSANPCNNTQPNVGQLVLQGSGGHAAAWMTNSTAADCSDLNGTTGLVDPVGQTALAGQIYVYGAGDSAEGAVPTGYKSHAIDLPSGNNAGPARFFGLLEAPNSTINLTVNNSCLKGGAAGGAMNIAQNLGFRWDQSATKLTGSEDRTFYRTAWSSCASVFDVAQPMDGC